MSFSFSSSWCQGLAAACDCGPPWTFILTFLYIKLVDDQDSHKILNDFEFWPDYNFDIGFTCPCMAEKLIFDFVSSLARSCLIPGV